MLKNGPVMLNNQHRPCNGPFGYHLCFSSQVNHLFVIQGETFVCHPGRRPGIHLVTLPFANSG
jgi:hypothetical protein